MTRVDEAKRDGEPEAHASCEFGGEGCDRNRQGNGQAGLRTKGGQRGDGDARSRREDGHARVFPKRDAKPGRQKTGYANRDREDRPLQKMALKGWQDRSAAPYSPHSASNSD